MRKAISSGLLVLLACISAANGCLTIYQDYNLGGNKMVMCESGNVPANWNDQASSITIPAGWRATLYRDYNYGGPSLNVEEGTWSAPSGWNDQLSSLVIYPGCPVFFRDYSLSGPYFVQCQSGNVAGSWNDQVSSIYVPNGFSLTLFRDYGYGGPSTTAGPGTWSAPSGWNDQLSSIQFTKACPVFYQDYGLSGPSFVACASGNVDPTWNDRVSSILVPAGWRLTLFRDYNYGGPSTTATPGTWSAPSGWNDQLSSFRVDAKN
jgi:hypothetical protein